MLKSVISELSDLSEVQLVRVKFFAKGIKDEEKFASPWEDNNEYLKDSFLGMLNAAEKADDVLIFGELFERVARFCKDEDERMDQLLKDCFFSSASHKSYGVVKYCVVEQGMDDRDNFRKAYEEVYDPKLLEIFLPQLNRDEITQLLNSFEGIEEAQRPVQAWIDAHP